MLPSFFAHLQDSSKEPLKEQSLIPAAVQQQEESADASDCNKPIVKVIVVGSGISGIAAARRLKAYNETKPFNFQVTVLEAKHYIGGRYVCLVICSGK